MLYFLSVLVTLMYLLSPCISKSALFSFLSSSVFNCPPFIASFEFADILPSSSPVIFLLTVILSSFNVNLDPFSFAIDVIPVKSPLTSTLNVAFLFVSSFDNDTVVFVPFAISNVSSFRLKSFVVGFVCFPSLNFNFESTALPPLPPLLSAIAFCNCATVTASDESLPSATLVSLLFLFEFPNETVSPLV